MHILDSVYVILKLLFLPDLMISRFNICFLSLLFKICIIFFACIARVGYDVFVFPFASLLYSLKKRNQRKRIGWVREQSYAHNVLDFYSNLNIVSGL